MRQRLPRHTTALLCVAAFALSWSTFAIQAQMPAAGKRPLTYDVYDAWRSIQGTTLSRDGEWLTYGLTAQGGPVATSTRCKRSNKRTGEQDDDWWRPRYARGWLHKGP